MYQLVELDVAAHVHCVLHQQQTDMLSYMPA
jgi:hypothetical protein